MGKLEFCENFVFLDGRPISFAGRPYLPAVYAAEQRNLVLRCSRQTEKTTFLTNTILFEACRTPGLQILLVLPRIEQADAISAKRLIQSIDQSPLLRRALQGAQQRPLQSKNMRFANGSELFLRGAFHSGDAARGLSAQLLLIDEFQDIADGSLPVLQETLSHAPHGGRTILTGTPKSVDNHLNSVFRQSTANEWTIDCGRCRTAVILDERTLGPAGLRCFGCGGPIDPQTGRWVARNPLSTWGDGFWIGHPMVPWLNYDGILERQRTYGIAQFKNEALGLPSTTGDSIVTRAELEACCTPAPMACTRNDIPKLSGELVAGIDWGGGVRSRTCLVIGFMQKDFVFRVVRFERFAAHEDPQRIIEELMNRCYEFRVGLIAADGGGNGHVYNRLLVDRLQAMGLCERLFAILYSASEQTPRQEGVLVKWTVDRSASLGLLFSRVKRRQMLFPRVEDSGTFLDELACEVSEYDDLNRAVRYTHPDSQPDDAPHATNYALLLAVQRHQAVRNRT